MVLPEVEKECNVKTLLLTTYYTRSLLTEIGTDIDLKLHFLSGLFKIVQKSKASEHFLSKLTAWDTDLSHCFV